MLPETVEITKIEVEAAKAVIELSLPEWPPEQKGYYEVYLWEAGDLNGVSPVFYCAYPSTQDDECVIKIIQPHLWQGVEKPYLYQLDIYRASETDLHREGMLTDGRELFCRQLLAVRSFQDIPQKGCLLNGEAFLPKAVYYDGIYDIYDKGATISREVILQKLKALAQMGANMVVLGSADNLSGQERYIFQKYCDIVGFILCIGKEECTGNAGHINNVEHINNAGHISNVEHISDRELVERKVNDRCVMGRELFQMSGLPTDLYYCCKSKWSREPFVYISTEGLCRQESGGYQLIVYTSCKKVTLLVNDRVFGFQEGAGELLFQDIQIKGFPVDITARTGEQSMTIRCFGG